MYLKSCQNRGSCQFDDEDCRWFMAGSVLIVLFSVPMLEDSQRGVTSSLESFLETFLSL